MQGAAARTWRQRCLTAKQRASTNIGYAGEESGHTARAAVKLSVRRVVVALPPPPSCVFWCRLTHKLLYSICPRWQDLEPVIRCSVRKTETPPLREKSNTRIIKVIPYQTLEMSVSVLPKHRRQRQDGGSIIGVYHSGADFFNGMRCC